MLSLSAIILLAVGASASSSYSAYNFDVGVSRFTPDGRLLQVEYAGKAADHSSPILAVKCQVDNRKKGGEDTDQVVILLCEKRLSCQDRLVLWPSIGRASTIIALSGILADNVALLQSLQDIAMQHERWFGSTTSLLTTKEIARHFADQCARHALGGGLRPYGATILIVGGNNENQCNESISTMRVDPSGSFTSMIENNDSMLSDQCCIRNFAVVGGSKVDTSNALLQRINDSIKRGTFDRVNDNGDRSILLSNIIKNLVGIMRQQDASSNIKASVEEDLGDDNNTEQKQIEVAVLSASKGAIKLSELALCKLLAE